MNRKILFSIMVLALVGMLLGTGIYAYFSDVETSTGNSFAAGTLNLKVGDNDPTTASISVTGLKPGDAGKAADWLVKNIGTISGNLTISVGIITNYENDRTEPEKSAGDITSGETEGELGSFLKVAIWLDMDKSGSWNVNDVALKSDGSILTNDGDDELPYDYLDNYGGESYASIITLSGNGEFRFMVDYEFPSAANDNQAQSDSAEFDLTFTLNQA